MPAALSYAICILIWGSTWFVIKFQLGVVPESVSLVYRFGLAAFLLMAYLIIRRQNLRYGRQTHVWFAGLGATLFCFNYLLTYMATHYLNSGLIAVLFSSIAIFSALNGRFFLKEKVSRRLWVGIVIGMVGIFILFMHKVGTVDYTHGTMMGFALALVASYLSSAGNMIAARLQGAVPVLQANAWGMLYGTGLQLIVVVLTGESFVFDARPAYIISLLYLSVFGSVIAFVALFILIKRVGTARSGYIGLATPIVALLLSTIFENFEWTPEKLVGVVIVLFGKSLVMLRTEHIAWLRQKLTVKNG
ncbi:MAG TPA: EamA family transporter [Alphaproteobacteria bacterium]|nr:EamA family transporter [Rhodospirillaceae bacterium]HRJ11804.1 EamA family transporter [Alphaproteobacteria bacterium]